MKKHWQAHARWIDGYGSSIGDDKPPSLWMLKRTNTLICFSLSRLLKTCVLHRVCGARALIVHFSFAWCVCLFVYRLDFLFFGCCACVAFFHVIFSSHHNVECVNRDVDIYVHYVVLFSLSRFRFNFWFDAAEMRNHINITQEMHMFFLFSQANIICVWSTYKCTCTLVSSPPVASIPLCALSRISLRTLPSFARTASFFLLSVSFLSPILFWICLSESISIPFFCVSCWNFEYEPFRTFFPLRGVFSHNNIIQNV